MPKDQHDNANHAQQPHADVAQPAQRPPGYFETLWRQGRALLDRTLDRGKESIAETRDAAAQAAQGAAVLVGPHGGLEAAVARQEAARAEAARTAAAAEQQRILPNGFAGAPTQITREQFMRDPKNLRGAKLLVDRGAEPTMEGALEALWAAHRGRK